MVDGVAECARWKRVIGAMTRLRLIAVASGFMPKPPQSRRSRVCRIGNAGR